MKWPSIYRGWDDRRLPVKLQPTWWASRMQYGVGLVIGCFLLQLGISRLTDWAVWPIPWLPIMLGALAAVTWTFYSERPDGLIPKRLRKGRCPQCLYILDNVPREEDNATVCPECGAAWVLPGKAKKG